MTDTSSLPKGGNGKLVTGFIATGISIYTMNYFSLHGINFQLMGVDSEIVKASIIALVTTFLTWLTPQHVVDKITAAIVFLKRAKQQINNAGEEVQ